MATKKKEKIANKVFLVISRNDYVYSKWLNKLCFFRPQSHPKKWGWKKYFDVVGIYSTHEKAQFGAGDRVGKCTIHECVLDGTIEVIKKIRFE